MGQVLRRLFLWISGLRHPAIDPLFFENLEHSPWNNFVIYSQPDDYPAGSIFRDAALANLYMGRACNGGLNSFLTNSWEIDGIELLNALRAIGAKEAAEQFEFLLRSLGGNVPRSSQEDRWQLLELLWKEEMEECDTLSGASYSCLLEALEQHVRDNEAFYRALK